MPQMLAQTSFFSSRPFSSVLVVLHLDSVLKKGWTVRLIFSYAMEQNSKESTQLHSQRNLITLHVESSQKFPKLPPVFCILSPNQKSRLAHRGTLDCFGVSQYAILIILQLNSKASISKLQKLQPFATVITWENEMEFAKTGTICHIKKILTFDKICEFIASRQCSPKEEETISEQVCISKHWGLSVFLEIQYLCKYIHIYSFMTSRIIGQ